jgi:hypothetical protein
MSVAQLLDKAAAMGVTLRLEGDAVKVGGPRAAREAMRPELAAHKPEIIAHLRAAANDAVPADCVGALRTKSSALYLPWGPYLSPDDVGRLRADLVGMIEALAVLEAWPDDCRDDVLARAIRGPLSDLLPNLHYFSKRTDEARAEHEARKVERSRSWRANDDLQNRGY